MRIKFLSKIADRIFEKHGWKKVEEDKIVIAYEQSRPKSNYTARVEIAHNKYHPNVVHCYDATNIKGPDYFSPSVGMDAVILWAALLKMIGVGFLPDPEAKKKTPWGEDASRSFVIKAERGGMTAHEFNKFLFNMRRSRGNMNKRIRKKIAKRKSYKIHCRLAKAATESAAFAMLNYKPLKFPYMPHLYDEAIEDFRKNTVTKIVDFMNEICEGEYKFGGRIMNGNIEIFPIR